MRNMNIVYKEGFVPETDDVIYVYRSSGIRRPVDDRERIKSMYENSSLVISAWHDDKLIGVARCLTDFCYACYLSDLAVAMEYQKSGVGKELIYKVRDRIGNKTALILLSAAGAMEYYPKVGSAAIDNGFIIRREC